MNVWKNIPSLRDGTNIAIARNTNYLNKVQFVVIIYAGETGEVNFFNSTFIICHLVTLIQTFHHFLQNNFVGNLRAVCSLYIYDLSYSKQLPGLFEGRFLGYCRCLFLPSTSTRNTGPNYAFPQPIVEFVFRCKEVCVNLIPWHDMTQRLRAQCVR